MPTKTEWTRVVFAADCDEDDNCPICGIDFGDCPCPGPTQEGWEYRVRRGILEARKVGAPDAEE